MRGRTSLRVGFSLVELLIMLAILGILAAIVVPKFSNASADARLSAIKIQVQELRQQVELYKGQHGGQLPDLVTNWNPLTGTSTFKSKSYGPYLPLIPKNNLNGLSLVTEGNGSVPAGAACGFVYDFQNGAGSGQVWATDSDGLTLLKL